MATFKSPGWATAPASPNTNMIADRDYDIDADGNLTDDAEKAAYHLIRKGQEIPKDMADKYGIGKVAQEDQDAATVKKAVEPASNKARTPASNKGVK